MSEKFKVLASTILIVVPSKSAPRWGGQYESLMSVIRHFAVRMGEMQMTNTQTNYSSNNANKIVEEEQWTAGTGDSLST